MGKGSRLERTGTSSLQGALNAIAKCLNSAGAEHPGKVFKGSVFTRKNPSGHRSCAELIERSGYTRQAAWRLGFMRPGDRGI